MQIIVIETANQLVAAAARNGVGINALHAAIALKYFDSNDEKLIQGRNYKIWMEPQNDPGNVCEYNVAELFEVAREHAEEAYSAACSNGHTDGDIILRLSEDVYILDIAVNEARKVVPVEIKTYYVNIIEQMKKTVCVEAASYNEAEEIVKKNHSDGLYGELSMSLHHVGTIINVLGPRPS